MSLDGKKAVVTGAAQGLGRAIAVKLASEGADLFLTDIQEDKLSRVAEEIAEMGGEVIAHAADVTNAEDVCKLFERAVESTGRIDALVNNAGGSGSKSVLRIEDVSDEDWDQTVDRNLKSAFLCCRAVVPIMRRQGYGRIVNLSSSSARGTFGDLGTSAIRLPYAAAKAGILGLTYQLARDVGPDGIYVNAVMPGFILTEPDARVRDRYEALPPEAQRAMTRSVPLGRPGSPEDVARAVAFLASDAASYTTGTVVDVTGGR